MKKKLLSALSRAFGSMDPADRLQPVRSLHLRALEPRVLLDAAAAATAAEMRAETELQQQHDESGPSHDSTESLLQALASHGAAPDAPQRSVVFIDSSVAEPSKLLAAFGATAEVHLIDAGEDGVQAIAAALAGRSGIDSLHIVSHGVEGALQLGSAVLDAQSMGERYADLLQGLRSSLSADADSRNARMCSTGILCGAVPDRGRKPRRISPSSWPVPAGRRWTGACWTRWRGADAGSPDTVRHGPKLQGCVPLSASSAWSSCWPSSS